MSEHVPRPAVSVDRLLTHRDWVTRLARALAADASQADDLAQEAWVRALARPPAHDGALRSWFGTVLRNLARNDARSLARRRARERASVADGTGDDPADLVALAEVQGRVVAAVVRLPEPLRGTVLLHHFEGLSLREVAARTDVSHDAAKKRLQRAHARLREMLDDEHDGDRRAWLLPLLAARATGRRRLPWAAGAAAAVALVAASVALTVARDGDAGLTAAVAPESVPAPAPPPQDADGDPSDAAARRRVGQASADAVPIDVRPDPATRDVVVAHVVDANGHPLAGARVVAHEQLEASPYVVEGEHVLGEPPEPDAETTTDEAGVARLSGLGQGDVGIVASAPGYGMATGYVRRGRGRAPRDPPVIVLGRGHELRGRVVDETGAPRSGLAVHAVLREAVSVPVYALARKTSVTGGGGWFAFDGLPAGDVLIEVGLVGGPRTRGTMVRLPDAVPVTIRIPRGGIVEGTVTDAANGAPLSGARVSVTCDSHAHRSRATATTDASGRYRVETLHPGRVLQVEVAADGYVLSQPMTFGDPGKKWFDLDTGATRTIDAALERGGGIRGRVEIDGASEAGWRVLAALPPGKVLRPFGTRTTAGGTFELTALPEGTFTLTVHPADGTGTLARHPDQVVVTAGAPPVEVTIRGETAAAGRIDVRGTVQSPDGSPIVGASVEGDGRAVFTDADGAFELPGVPRAPGAWVFVRASGYASRSERLPDDDADHVELGPITLGPCARIRGTVRDADGRPVGGVRVWLGDHRAGHGIVWHEYAATTTDASGAYELVAHQAEGRFSVRARGAGSTTAESAAIVHGGAPEVPVVDLELAPAPRLRGRVVNAITGEPVAGARIALVSTDPWRRSATSMLRQSAEPSVARSDADGTFEVADVEPGSYVVGAVADGHEDADADVSVRGADDEPVTIALRPFLTIEGVLLDEQGRPVADARVRAYPVDVRYRLEQRRTVRTDELGAFSLGPCLPGAWIVDAPDHDARQHPVAAGSTGVRLQVGVETPRQKPEGR